ncbi:MAG: alpha/beta fold hydrolase [Actinomycetota bacterium]|nr:alpha/beta fold hydrolase [Actinomycetota bacterium]
MEIHGHRVGYRSAGSGPVIVLVHGMAGSSATWRFVMPALAERFTVVAPDLVGHGESEKPRGDYSLGAFASGVRDLLLALGHERATLVGQSFGGGVAMQFAYQFPERCERLVLVSSGGLGDEVNMLLRLLALPGAEFVLPLACTNWLHDAVVTVAGWLAKIGLHPGPHLTETWNSYGSLADGETRTAFLQTLRSVIDVAGQRVSAADRLYLAAEVPTLIVWGDNDSIIPVEQGRAAHEAIPGSRLEIFEGTGHFPHCEHPDQFCEALIDFMNTTHPPTTSTSQWRDRMLARST